MAYEILCKIAYNGIDKENWIENRDPLMQRSRREKSTCLAGGLRRERDAICSP